MIADIVLPSGNEDEFIQMAKRLGYKSLCFAYSKLPDKKPKPAGLQIYNCALATIENAKKPGKSDLVIVESSEKDRRAVEKERPDLIFGFENSKKHDFLHQRNSGLNHILCRLAKENSVMIGFSFSHLMGMDPRLLGRVMQNIRLCRKHGTKMLIASFAREPYMMRSATDLASVFVSLGMRPEEAKAALEVAIDRIQHNRERKSPRFIAPGARYVD